MKPKDSLSRDDDKESDMITEFINLAEDNHTHGLFLSRMYRRAKDWYEDEGLEELMLKYAQKALEYDMRLLGLDNAVTHESMNARSWGCCRGEVNFLLKEILACDVSPLGSGRIKFDVIAFLLFRKFAR